MAYMSKEGYDKLRAEIKQLEEVERPEVIRQIQEAREKGDLLRMQSMMQQRKHKANLRQRLQSSRPSLPMQRYSTLLRFRQRPSRFSLLFSSGT